MVKKVQFHSEKVGKAKPSFVWFSLMNVHLWKSSQIIALIYLFV